MWDAVLTHWLKKEASEEPYKRRVLYKRKYFYELSEYKLLKNDCTVGAGFNTKLLPLAESASVNFAV